MTISCDYIIIGSGCSGAMAAQTLVEAGVKTLMLDVGKQDIKYKQLIPDKDFISIRQSEKDQYRYFLGDNFESIPWDGIKTGEQLTPARRFIIDSVDKYLPIDSKTFKPLESLAYGGLGSGWGTGCCTFSAKELATIGLPNTKMQAAYKVVSDRIGISGAKDDASPYTIGELDNYLPELAIDANAQYLYSKYLHKKTGLNAQGFFMGRPALAVLTKDLNGRKKMAYQDMDFYSDKDQSAYRPWITIEALKKSTNFEYIPNNLVLKFTEEGDFVEVTALNTQTHEQLSYRCKRLVLASGVLGTARIVLRSLPVEDKTLPLLCNPYCYIPCIQPMMFGKEIEQHKMGFAQLALFHDEEGQNFNVAMASIYSYRSLLLFRLIKETPLNFIDGRIIMNYLLSGIVIMGIHHPEASAQGKYLQLVKTPDTVTGDRLKAEYLLSTAETMAVQRREQKYMAAMRRLGCYALKKISPGHGSSIHYAGSLPFNDNNEAYTLSSQGRLNQTKNIFVADSSGFKYLPAKGLTLSLMANAHLVAQAALTDR